MLAEPRTNLVAERCFLWRIADVHRHSGVGPPTGVAPLLEGSLRRENLDLGQFRQSVRRAPPTFKRNGRDRKPP